MARIAQNEQPYTNMAARRSVLLAGFVISIAGFILVLLGFLFLFAPSVNITSDSSPSVVLAWLLACGIAAAFIGTVLTVAGANTNKGIARLSMFLSTISFIAGAALLAIILLFRTVLP
ncbi:MAG: hypothetical protein K2M36_03480, partial [Clostridia bacterium]|nr:hypothetical protein [Clostridia bacterium]